MIVSWMIYATIVTGLFAIVAALLERVLQSHAKPTRIVWAAAIFASLLFNANAIWRAQSVNDVAALEGPTPAQAGSTSRELHAEGGEGQRTRPTTILYDFASRSPLARTQDAVVSALDQRWLALRSSALLRNLDRTMLLLWGIASAFSILLLAGSAVRLQRRRNLWRRASVRGVPILVTDGVGPAVVGVMESEIAVPDWIFRLDPTQQQLIVEHERQHLLARDPAVMLGALLAAALVPWNAPIWAMVRRLRRSTEMDCDQRVLAAHPTPRAYAALLVDIGSHSLPQPSFGQALADPTSDLERRVYDILKGRQRIPGAVVAFRIAISAAIVVAACAAPAPRVDREPAATPEMQAPPTRPQARSDSAAQVTTKTAPATATTAATTATGTTATGTTATATTVTATTATATTAAAPPRASAGARVAGAAAAAAPANVTQARGARGTPAARASSAGAPPQVAQGTARGGRGAPGGIAAAIAQTTVARGAPIGGRATVAGAAPGGRGAGAPPTVPGRATGAMAIVQGRGTGAPAFAQSRGTGAPTAAQGRGAGAPPTARGRAASAAVATGGQGRGRAGGRISVQGTMTDAADAFTISSGSFRRENAVVSGRIPSMDSVAILAARKYPQLFTESAKTDSLTVVFALDTLGNVLATASLPIPLQPGLTNIPKAEQIFLDIMQQEVKYGEWRAGAITPRGFPTKTMSLLFLVFGPK